MGIKYELAQDIQQKVDELALVLFPHVRIDSVVCIRSYGSSSRGTIARCHALGKAMQIALGRRGFYVIEVISKRFDRLSYEEKVKTLIHELMHIPKSFGGGFIHHNIVCDKNVNRVYEHYVNLKKIQDNQELLFKNTEMINKRDSINFIYNNEEKSSERNRTLNDFKFIVKKKKRGFFNGYF